MKKVLAFLFPALLLAPLLSGQSPIPYYSNTATGNLTAQSTNCLGVAQTGCTYLQVMPYGSTATVVLTGTWSATLQIEATTSAGLLPTTLDNGTWTIISPVFANGTFSFPIAGDTWIRVRCSAFTSGTAVAALTVSTNPGNIATPLLQTVNLGGVTITPATPTGAYTLTIPALSGNDTVPTLGLPQTLTGAQTYSGGIINTVTPIRDTTRQVLAVAMTAVNTAGVKIGSTGTGNTTFSWPVTTANWYDMQCKLPVTFVASATIAFELVSNSGSVTASFVNGESAGNTGSSAAFQDLYATGAAITTPTTTTGAPGGVSEMVTVGFQFLTSHAGAIGIEFIGNAANNVQMLEGGECGLTQIN